VKFRWKNVFTGVDSTLCIPPRCTPHCASSWDWKPFLFFYCFFFVVASFTRTQLLMGMKTLSSFILIFVHSTFTHLWANASVFVNWLVESSTRTCAVNWWLLCCFNYCTSPTYANNKFDMHTFVQYEFNCITISHIHPFDCYMMWMIYFEICISISLFCVAIVCCVVNNKNPLYHALIWPTISLFFVERGCNLYPPSLPSAPFVRRP